VFVLVGVGTLVFVSLGRGVGVGGSVGALVFVLVGRGALVGISVRVAVGKEVAVGASVLLGKGVRVAVGGGSVRWGTLGTNRRWPTRITVDFPKQFACWSWATLTPKLEPIL
jgi:hypothetical protein